MQHLAVKPNDNSVFQECARVVEVMDAKYRLQSGDCLYEACRAASCLLVPQVGDLVLAALNTSGCAYVLAILEREDGTVQQIDLKGEVQLRVREGRLKITSQEGIDLTSAGDMRAISEDICINAVRGRVGIHDCEYLGGSLRARLSSINWLCDIMESMVQRLTQRVKRLYRIVDEFEQVKAGRMDYLVSKLLSFRSQYTVMTSREDVKVDAERIHIG